MLTHKIRRQKCPDNAYDNKIIEWKDVPYGMNDELIGEDYEKGTKTAGRRVGQADGRGT